MTMRHNDSDRTDMGTYDYATRLVAGAEVFGADNEKIGHVADVGQNYFLVQKGWLFIRDLYLPTRLIAQADADHVYLSVTKQQAEDMARDELPASGNAWYGTETTATTGTGYTSDRVTDTAYGAADSTTDYGTDREVRTGENISVPVVEEQLQAGVREKEAGRARIVKDVTEKQQTLNVPVEREEVYITERAVNRPATQADMAMREQEIEIPLKEQEVVTQKQAMVTGEINVRKETRRDTEQVTDTVRREDVHVEQTGDPNVHVQGERGTTNRTTDPGYTATDRTTDTGYGATGRTDAAAYDARYTVSGEPTDTAYDRTSMAGDNRSTSDSTGILDRAKEKLREADDRRDS
jgi:uncharacterized protein (TIGR02271 family)